MRPIDRDFARYRTTHDPAALAAVFDAVAPELLLVAAHFARPGIDAEDLVQATFVDAIEKATRWDSSRPLVPWLIGILVNHARAARRRAAKPIDVARLARATVNDPLEELAANEVAQRVSEALRGLPRQYRQALTLRLVHGLTPTQIAHAIGCPVATVKTRLQRGLDWLRRTLPAGIAGALAVAMTSPKSLAAVRVAVLVRANAIVPVAAAGAAVAIASTGLVMKKLVAAAVAIAIGVALWTAVDPLASDRKPSPAITDTAEPRVAGLARDASANGTIPDGTSTGVRAAIAAEPLATTGSAVLTCVWKDDGTPATGVRLLTYSMPNGPSDSRPRMSVDSRSDEVGRVDLRDLEAGEYHVTGRGGWTSIRIAAGTRTEARFELMPELRIDGRVVDHAGAAVADAEVWLQYFPDPQDDQPRKVASSGADGTFRCALDFGGSLWARKTAHASSAYADVVREGHADVVLELGAGSAMLRGSVRNADGSPAVHARIDFVRDAHEDSQHAPLVLWSDAQGAFATDELASGAWRVVAQADDHAPTMRRITIDPDAVLELRLERGAELFGEVRDGTGASIAASIDVRPAWALDQRALRHLCVRRVVADETGRYRLPHVPSGELHLEADANDAPHVESTLHALDGRELRHDVVFDRGASIEGRVVAPSGDGLARWRVAASPIGGGHGHDAITDDDGRFAMRGVDPGEYSVSARPEHCAFHRPWTPVLAVAAGGAPAELRALAAESDGAWLKGTLADREGQPVAHALARLWIENDPRGESSITELHDSQGRFGLGPVPPGRYAFAIRLGEHGWLHLGVRDITPGSTIDLGRIVPPAPGRLAIRLRAPRGQTVEPLDVSVHDSVGNGSSSFTSDADGIHRSAPLPPGRYRLRAWGEGFAPLRTELVVVAERESLVELEVAPATAVTFAVRKPQGVEERWTATAYFALRQVQGEYLDGRTLTIDTTDEFAWTRGLAPGRYAYELRAADGPQLRGEFDVVAGTDAQRIEIAMRSAR